MMKQSQGLNGDLRPEQKNANCRTPSEKLLSGDGNLY